MTDSIIMTGDCLDLTRTIPNQINAKIDLTVTSPPYPGLKGNKQTPHQWLAWIRPLWHSIFAITSANGMLAVNIGSSRSTGGWFDNTVFSLLPRHIEKAGWNHVDTYAFIKKNPVANGPVSRIDISGWEPIYLFTKATSIDDFYYRPARVPYASKSINSNGTMYTTRTDVATPHPEGAKQRNIIEVSSSGEGDRPRAKGQSFPLAVPERFIRQYSRPGDWVFDPFAGVGTTIKAAQKHGRNGIGIELVDAEVERAREWLAVPYNLPLFPT